jgi:hypothetical protein
MPNRRARDLFPLNLRHQRRFTPVGRVLPPKHTRDCGLFVAVVCVLCDLLLIIGLGTIIFVIAMLVSNRRTFLRCGSLGGSADFFFCVNECCALAI